MNKIICLFFSMLMFYGIHETKAQTMQKVINEASVNIITSSEIAQVEYLNSVIQTVPISAVISSKSIVYHSENGKQITSATQNLARFSVYQECNNSFSITLPTDSIILKNSKNNNAIQVEGWKSSSQLEKDKSQNDIRVINIGATLKIISANEKQGGFYTGTFPISFDYN